MPKTPKPKIRKPPSEAFDKNYTKGRVAVEKLAETLEVSFEGITIDQRIGLLEAKVKDKTFSELLQTGDEGATAGLLSVVWNAALPNLIGRQAVQVMTGTTPSIRVPKAAKAKAFCVGKMGGAPIRAEAYSYAEAVARLWEAVPVVPRTLIEDATWDVIERQYAEGARALADAETEEIVLGLIADQTGGTEATSEAITWAKIAAGAGVLEAADWHPDTIIMHPSEFWTLMQDSNLSQWVQWALGKQAIIETGQMPVIAGMKILKTSKQTDATVTIEDSKAAGVLYVRRDITVEDYKDPVQDLAGAVLTSRFRYKVVRPTAIYTLTAKS